MIELLRLVSFPDRLQIGTNITTYGTVDTSSIVVAILIGYLLGWLFMALATGIILYVVVYPPIIRGLNNLKWLHNLFRLER